MSNFLAIATATETLRQLIEAAVQVDVNGANVTMLRPNAPATELPSTGVNLYLYQVTPNAAWRNADVPTRRPNGEVMQRPRTAIDLHYLLSFYGRESELEPQRLLGSTIRTLHEEPMLSRRRLRQVIDDAGQPNAQHAYLAASNLDEEVELVKFTPLPLNLEELSKLWSVFFQTPYALSVAYQGTVILIEGESTPRPALPVRERNVYVLPFRQPLIEQVIATTGVNTPISASSTLRISGKQLRGNTTRVRIDQIEVTPPLGAIGDTQIELALPVGLRAGVHGVQISQPALMGTPPVEHSGVESNVMPFVLQPTITAPVASNITPMVVDGITLFSATITVTFTPNVGRTQRVKLLLYEFNAPANRLPRAYTFDAPRDNGIDIVNNPNQVDTATVAFATELLFSGPYLVRVQVDGAESPLSPAEPGQYNAPQVTI